MTIIEMEKQLQEEGLLVAHIYGTIKQYVTEDEIIINDKWNNMTDVYGIIRKSNKYYFFITDSERGIPQYNSSFETEDEACDALLKRVTLAERIYKEEHPDS